MTTRTLAAKLEFFIRLVFSRRVAAVTSLFVFGCLHGGVAQAGICDRTPAVTAGTLELLPDVEDCAVVTPDHLAGISAVMDLSSKQIDSLQRGDFEGLANLFGLDLRDNNLEGIPAGTFSGLQNLDTLYLDDNRLTELPFQLLDEIPRLRVLGLKNNELTKESLTRFRPPADTSGLNTPLREDSFMLDALDALAHIDTLRIEDGHISEVSVSSATGGRSQVAAAYQPDPSMEYRNHITAARLFPSSLELDPTQFAGFGIVAFTSGPLSQEERYLSICEGYFNTFVNVVELTRRPIDWSDLFVTYWPTRWDEESTIGSARSFEDAGAACGVHVRALSLQESQNAVQRAERQIGSSLSGAGPFLLGWYKPAETWEAESATVLILDLSMVQNTKQATRAFGFWKDQIERDPRTWRNGWNLEEIRMKLAFLADSLGRLFVGFWQDVRPLG